MKKFKFLSLLYYWLLGTIVPGMAQVPSTAPRTAATPVARPGALQTLTASSVRVWIPSMITTDPNAVFDTSRSTADVKLTTQYLDGLGRPLQTITRRISSKGNDLVTAFVYDSLGREQYKYLPYVQEKDSAHNGKIKSDPFGAQASFYQDVDLNPGIADEHVYYSQTEYENSPLNRVLKTWAPGDSWAKTGGNHPVQMQYYYNDATDAVRIWNIGISRKTCSGTANYRSISTVIPSSSGIYAAGQLIKNVVIDEAGHQSIEYKDKSGQVILKKVQLSDSPGMAHDGWLCTYYVYDDMGALRFVIPPLAVQQISSDWTISQTIADELCYQYLYDARGRMISKKIPGAGAVYMAYDSRNRLVFTQDSVQRQKSSPEWLTTFYDGLNRPYETAIYTTSSTREALQCGITTNLDDTATINLNLATIPADLVVTSYVSTDNPYRATNSITFNSEYITPDGTEMSAYIVNTGGITNVVAVNPIPNISSSALTPLTYTYYDNYNYDGALSFVSSDLSKLTAGNNLYSQPVTAQSSRTNTLTTGSQVRVLGTEKWLTTTTFYDDDGRIIQVLADNNVGGKNIQSSLYDFSNKKLCTLINESNPKSSTTPQTSLLTMMAYNDAASLISITKRINGNAALDQTISTISYDELNNIHQKKLGISGQDSQLDSLTYTYNIRGWVQGINKAFVNSNNINNWFGQEIDYDNGFDVNQYNGNITGIRWKTKSNGIPRAYGFEYDNANRLIKAAYNQQNSVGAPWNVTNTDFSVNGVSYDANGNISKLKQQGLIGTSSSTIDDLSYKYDSLTNRLISVNDNIKTKTAKLGDFNDSDNEASSYDYKYDVNGNLIADQNKSITAIAYNYLNLPEKISIKGKGYITYQYSASGAKLTKTVVDSTGTQVKTTVSDYTGIFQYEKDTLQYITHEEGRIRPVYDSGKAITFKYDYFERDHLENVRIVLTTQSDTSVYAATMETGNSAKENALFSNIDNTRVSLPSGYPSDPTTNPNEYVSRLNAVNGQKIGPSLVLRVMAGDTVKIGAKAFYKSTGTNTSNATSSSMLIALLEAFSGNTISDGVHAGVGSNSPINTNFNSSEYEDLKTKDPDENLSDKPKAYLNYVLFDDMFNMVDENSGVKQVQGSPDELQTLSVDRSIIKKTGFLYIYTSNESGEDVYFDNLVVAHNGGPLLEETHYYPFGLIMQGISSKALKPGTSENRKKFNGIEHTTEFDLNTYDAFYRNADPQIGRWWQIDPKPNMAESPYSMMSNNPIRFSDPLGDTLLIQYQMQDIIYNNGVLSNKDGSAYAGKLKGFLKQTVNALNAGRTKSAEANGIVGELQGSKNIFTIVKGNTNKTDYNPSQRLAAYANQLKTDPAQAHILAGATPAQLAGGSGSTITWNPKGDDVWVVGGGQDNNPTINLFHELGHALDDNRGQRDDRIPDPLYPQIDRSEWQATYRENLIRQQMGSPLRNYYLSGDNGGGTLTPYGSYMLDATNNPILPTWYTH